MRQMGEREIALVAGIPDKYTHDKVMQVIQDVHEQACSLWSSLEEWPLPTVTYKVRGMTAGLAYQRENRICLNLDYLLSENSQVQQDMYEDTIPHEMAHIITHQLYPGASAHGESWKNVMRKLGQVPSRCHQYEVVRARNTRKFLYSCECRHMTRPHQLGLNRHKKQQNGEKVFVCVRCGGELRFLKEKE